MTTKTLLYEKLSRSDHPVTISELNQNEIFGNRTYVSLLLRELISAGKVTKIRHGRNILYSAINFTISKTTPKSLQKLFEAYSLDRTNFSFSTTSIPVKLFESGTVWISRFQAKRILSGLDQYQKIVFDFSGISLIGQGFADEIFRVFHRAHPEIILETINTNPSVELMINHAKNDTI